MYLLPTLLLLPTVFATTTIHYYKVASCNSGTDVGSFDAPLNATAQDLSCHSISNVTKALYINGLDDDCGVIAYTDDACSPSAASPKIASKGQCFYLDNFGTISSWRSVCGSSLAAASSASVATSTTSTSAAASATSSLAAAATSATRNAASDVGVGVDGMWGLFVAGVLGWAVVV